jgi:hypothetical protein
MPTNEEIRGMIERLHAAFHPTIEPSAFGIGADAAAMLSALLAERDIQIDKINGLSSDLDSAIAVMRRRINREDDIARTSMGEWLDLNYPKKGE